MSLSSITADIRAAAEADEGKFRQFIDEHLPVLEEAASAAEAALASPVTQAVLAAAHISPEFASAVAEMITRAEADLVRVSQPPAEPAG